MQTPKTKVGSLEVPSRKSPTTTRTSRQLNSDTNNKPMRTPKTSPKVVDRRSPRSPATEKKRPIRPISDLESQLLSLQDQLSSTREDLRSTTTRLEESERRLKEMSQCEDERVLELRALSQERDKAWQSELEAVRRQHSMDSAALANASAEIQKLKANKVISTKKEVEVEEEEEELSEALELVRSLRDELRARQVAAEEAESELERNRARVRSLEGLVGKLQSEVISGCDRDDEEVKELRVELGSVRSEAARLKSALDAAEIRYQEEFIRSTLQTRSAYEQAERIRAESAQTEAQLTESKARVEELEARLLDKETELQSVSEENEGLLVTNQQQCGSRDDVAEIEAELRRVKIQAEQWRKAAEAAAAMLDGPIGSPCSDDNFDDESLKKKNGNVLKKKFGVLWKKGAHK